MDILVIAHAGAGSRLEHTDATDAACQDTIKRLQDGATPLDAAVSACALLEDDPRLNAGTGSTMRLDGTTIEMDAACMTGEGAFGAVAALQHVKNPILVARHVLDTPHLLLVGEGARRLARRLGHDQYDPATELAADRCSQAWKTLRSGDIQGGWNLHDLKESWNYAVPPPAPDVGVRSAAGPAADAPRGSDLPVEPPEPRSDTVGVVVRYGRRYAAASSSGGIQSALLGRVGDVPLFGAGIFAGPQGAVAVTGDGEHLSAKLLSWHVYQDLQHRTASAAVEAAIDLFDADVEVGLVAVGADGGGGASNRHMAWSMREVHA